MILDTIAKKHGTDKSSKGHNYCKIYECYFEPLRYQSLTLLEIGVGGYDKPTIGGHSLRAWKEYFPSASIIGVDIHEKNLNEHRIRCYQGSQDDPAFLQSVIFQEGRPDIIIDDGSHINEL